MKYYYDYVSVGGENKIGIHDGKNYIKIISADIKTNPAAYRARYGKEKWLKDLKLFNNAKLKQLYGNIMENKMKKSELIKMIKEEYDDIKTEKPYKTWDVFISNGTSKWQVWNTLSKEHAYKLKSILEKIPYGRNPKPIIIVKDGMSTYLTKKEVEEIKNQTGIKPVLVK